MNAEELNMFKDNTHKHVSLGNAAQNPDMKFANKDSLHLTVCEFIILVPPPDLKHIPIGEFLPG